jgi:hypothetical protein
MSLAMDFGSFSLSACYCNPLKLPEAYVNQPKVLVASEACHVIATANIPVDGTAGDLKGNIG